MFEVIDVHKRKGNGFDNLTGRRFGKLTVIGLSAKKAGRKSYWVCQAIVAINTLLEAIL